MVHRLDSLSSTTMMAHWSDFWLDSLQSATTMAHRSDFLLDSTWLVIMMKSHQSNFSVRLCKVGRDDGALV